MLPIPREDLDAARPKILQLLSTVPTPVDEIVRRCQFSTAVALTILLEAELAGLAERLPGNQVVSTGVTTGGLDQQQADFGVPRSAKG